MRLVPATILMGSLACVAFYHAVGALRRGERRVGMQRFCFSGAMASLTLLVVYATSTF